MAPEHLVAASLAFGAAPDKPVQPGLKTGSVSFATRHPWHYWFLAGLWILLIWLDFGFLVSSIYWLTLLVLASLVQFGVLPLHLHYLELILKGVCSLRCR